jgi:hypothetical protein
LAKAPWVPKDGVSITVTNGVVDLNGVILDERNGGAPRRRRKFPVKASGSPGLVEPLSGIVVDPPQDEYRRGTRPLKNWKEKCALLLWDCWVPSALLWVSHSGDDLASDHNACGYRREERAGRLP